MNRPSLEGATGELSDEQLQSDLRERLSSIESLGVTTHVRELVLFSDTIRELYSDDTREQGLHPVAFLSSVLYYHPALREQPDIFSQLLQHVSFFSARYTQLARRGIEPQLPDLPE